MNNWSKCDWQVSHPDSWFLDPYGRGEDEDAMEEIERKQEEEDDLRWRLQREGK